MREIDAMDWCDGEADWPNGVGRGALGMELVGLWLGK